MAVRIDKETMLLCKHICCATWERGQKPTAGSLMEVLDLWHGDAELEFETTDSGETRIWARWLEPVETQTTEQS